MSTTFEAVQAQYEKNQKAVNSNKFSKEDRMKKYFFTLLAKGETSGERRVRIPPTKDGSTPFQEVFFHEINVNGEWLKLYDPKQEGKRSPLNEVYDGLMLTGVVSDKVLARQYRARKFFIVKVIDRDNEADGPKFWRFKNNTKKDGVFDKIYPLFKNKGDITDPKDGRDLIITLGLTTSGNGKEYTTITSIIPEDKSPLHEDPKVAEAWINDDTVWSDVYSKKSEEYLELVANGEVPKWDSEAKKFVSSTTEETTIMEPVEAEVDPQADEPSDSDQLPF